MAKGMSKGGTMSLHQGMTRLSPAGVDASMKPGKGHVDSDAKRETTASTPKTLGPRDA